MNILELQNINLPSTFIIKQFFKIQMRLFIKAILCIHFSGFNDMRKFWKLQKNQLKDFKKKNKER